MKKMITRTIEVNTYTVRTLNVSTAEVLDVDYKLGTQYANSKPLDELKSVHETEDFKLVAIVNHTKTELLYGMDEQTFIQLAEVLPPRKTAD